MLKYAKYPVRTIRTYIYFPVFSLNNTNSRSYLPRKNQLINHLTIWSRQPGFQFLYALLFRFHPNKI